MKSYISIFMLYMLLGATTNIHAQTAGEIHKTEQAIKQDGKYALLVMKPQHLKAGILSGENFKMRNKGIDFQIVLCGEVVKELLQDKSLQKLVVNTVKNHGLKILVCGLSLQQLGIDKSLLPVETPVTDNGLIYFFGLEEQGYKTIAL
jgi:intracellular sulfur oxidation DsrE/DsrF family protein